MNELRNILFGFLHWIPSSDTKCVPCMQAQQAKINFIISDGLSVLFHTRQCTCPPPTIMIYPFTKYLYTYSFQRFCFVQPFFTSPFINSIYVPQCII